jgi:hypothetical protein
MSDQEKEQQKSEESDSEGQLFRRSVSNEGEEQTEDTEGQSLSRHVSNEGEEQDDTEGHGRRILSNEGEEQDDTEGHASASRRRV